MHYKQATKKVKNMVSIAISNILDGSQQRLGAKARRSYRFGWHWRLIESNDLHQVRHIKGEEN